MLFKMVRITLFKTIATMERNLPHLPILGQVGIYDQVTGSQGEGNGNSLLYSYLETPVDRGAWWAAVYRVAQSQTRLKQLSMHAWIGEGNGNPLQYSCLETPRDRGAWWAAVYGVAQSWTQLKRLNSSSTSNRIMESVDGNWLWGGKFFINWPKRFLVKGRPRT